VGITHPTIKDALIERVAKNPMKEGDFIKYYVMTDRFSGHRLDHLQMVQIELPRAETLNLFPPNSGFSEQRWWLSILNHSKEYTTKYIEKLYKEEIMPHEIYEGLNRIKYDKWPSGLKENYQHDLAEMRRIYDPQITMDLNTAIEKGISIGEARGISMGKQEGISMGKQEGIKNMALKMLKRGVSIAEIADITELSEQEILQLKK
jgi:predicted transposase/invertase (TIGR01784 family)